ncbi:hypothetical protein Csa_018296 [Cucumis sativus]|uniref:Uncharacterized protein n=1 Tax=Cucumis sativus TaxID=3659 RepID=A0A0A0KDP8_CUCSA|nr:hypothetical protein Csa_018296 [Cucumis sativus]
MPKESPDEEYRQNEMEKRKQIYIVRSPVKQAHLAKAKNERNTKLKIQPKEDKEEMADLKLVVDLGPLSPLSDEFLSSSDLFTPSLSPTSPTQPYIVKGNIAPMMISDQEEKEKSDKEEEETTFKQKLEAFTETDP